MATDVLTGPTILGTATRTRVYKNFIDGEWVEASTGQTFENRNPADTRDVVGIFQRSGKADVEAAIAAAKRAFAKWRLIPAPRRAEIIYRAAEMLMERKEEYARDMTREMGKILKETRGDVQEAVDTAYYMAGEGRRMFGPTTPSELPNKFAMAVRQPIGVCGMITPWNFPMAIPSWKLLPALVCGNTCVIKPAQDTPLSTFNLVRVLYDAGLPRGVVNIVTGFGSEVGTPITEHADVKVISLTGSSAVGRVVGTTAAKSFKHCSLELGGKNPMIVLDDANLELAIEGGLWGGFGTTGQRCTATSRIIVQKGIYSEFIEHYVERAKALKVGNGLDETVEMGPAINENQLKTDLSYVDIGKAEGARLKCGGNRLDKGEYQNGLLHGTDCIRRRGSKDADCTGGNLWAGSFDYCLRRPRRRHRNRERHRLRFVFGALHQRREQSVRGHARSSCWNYLYQCADDWCGSASAFRWSKGYRQWSSRGRSGRNRLFQRVEIDLRRLFRPLAEGAD